MSVCSQTGAFKFRCFLSIPGGADACPQDESLYDRSNFSTVRPVSLICSWISSLNCVIAEPWKTREVVNNYDHLGLKLTPAKSLNTGFGCGR